MDIEAVERVQQGQCHGIPSRWMGDTRCWKQASGENPTCHCVLQTLLSFQYEEAEAGGQTFHPAHAGKYGYKAVTICSDDTDIFVMWLMFQYKISVSLIKQFGTKTMVRLIDLVKFGATSGI